jgi:hypothetical protein
MPPSAAASVNGFHPLSAPPRAAFFRLRDHRLPRPVPVRGKSKESEKENRLMEILKLQAIELPIAVDDEPVAAHTTSTVTVTTVVTII